MVRNQLSFSCRLRRRRGFLGTRYCIPQMRGPKPRQRTASSALLPICYKDDYYYYYYTALGFIVVNHLVGVLTMKLVYSLIHNARKGGKYSIGIFHECVALFDASDVFLYFFGGITGHAIEGCKVVDAGGTDCAN
jgi:hypothetical protein